MLPQIIRSQEISSILVDIIIMKMTEDEAISHWHQFVDRATRIEKPFIRDLKQAFRQQEDQMLRKMGELIRAVDNSMIERWLFPKEEWVDRIGTIGGVYLKDAIDKTGRNEMQGLVMGVGFDVNNPRVIEYIQKRIYKFSFDVNTETQDMLKLALREGMNAGESIYELRKRVSAVFDMSSKYRAERIARTEVIRASNAGAEMAYIQSGVVSGKRWWTAQDEKRCPWCASMHGKEMGLGKNFYDKGDRMTVDGASMKLDYDDITYPPLHPHCYSKDTEIYTRQGWQYITDIVIGTEVLTLKPDTKDLEWGKVTNKVESYADQMVHISNKQKSFSMLVTPDHPFFGYKRVDHDPKPRTVDPVLFNSINELHSEFKFYISSRWHGLDIQNIKIADRTFDTIDFCKFMGYYLSEGSVVKRKTGRYEISITQTNLIKREIMWELISILPVRKTYLGHEKIWIQDNDLGRYLEKFGKCYEKYVPDEIKELSPHYIRIFLDAFLLGDGTIKKAKKWNGGKFVDSKSYSTSSNRLAGDLGELIIKAGKSVRYFINKTKGKPQTFRNGTYILNHDIWIVYELSSQYKMFRNMFIKLIPYNDKVYDVEVEPNHTILTRYHGRVVWGSNCRCCLIPIVIRV